MDGPAAGHRACGAGVCVYHRLQHHPRPDERSQRAKPQIPDRAWRTTRSGSQKNIYFNGEGVEIFHQPATTDGDSIVLFRRSDVVVRGSL